MTEAMVFRKTETVLALTLATARSCCPFPLRSSIATENGPVPGPVAKSVFAAKLPVPVPSRTEIVLEPKLATTRSSMPSSFTSPIATDRGPAPTGKSVFSPRVPSPTPSSTETVPASALATTTSSRPSPFTSAMATSRAPAPVWKSVFGPKLAVPETEQHGHRVGADVDDHEIGYPIPVEIANGHEERCGAGGEVHGGGEGS